MRLAILAFALVLGAPAAALAQAPALDPAKVEQAIRLLDAQDFDNGVIHSADVNIELMMASLIEQIQKTAPGPLPPDFLAALRKTFRDHTIETMRANLAQMKRQSAEIYAAEFTLEELRHLTDLQQDPVLVKSRDRAKVIEPRLMMVGVSLMRAHEDELQRKVEAVVGEYLRKLRADEGDKSS